MKSKIALLISIFLITGCKDILNVIVDYISDTNPARNVYFFKELVQNEDGIIPVYMDAFGTLYPHSMNGQEMKFEYDGSLYNLFLSSNVCSTSTNSDVSYLCQNLSTTTCRQNAPSATGLPSGMSNEICHPESPRLNAQSRMWDKLAENIYAKATEGDKNRGIIFLIHGFNTKMEQARLDYRTARNQILDSISTDDKYIFVGIYWDGFTADEKELRLANAWRQAQAGGPLVGFHLRELFNYIEKRYTRKTPKIRVLTHSSGAFVIGATMGNPISALPKMREKDSCKFPDHYFFSTHASCKVGNFSIPKFEDMRVGLLAAATPTTTFVGGNSYYKMNLFGWLNPNATLIFSINPYDDVLKKKLGGNLVDEFGATGLGLNSNKHKDNLLDGLCKRKTEYYAYDFSRDTSDREYQISHAFQTYLTQPEAIPFLKNLLEGELTDTSRLLFSVSKFKVGDKLVYRCNSWQN